jgi:hypothetical protein
LAPQLTGVVTAAADSGVEMDMTSKLGPTFDAR